MKTGYTPFILTLQNYPEYLVTFDLPNDFAELVRKNIEPATKAKEANNGLACFGPLVLPLLGVVRNLPTTQRLAKEGARAFVQLLRRLSSAPFDVNRKLVRSNDVLGVYAGITPETKIRSELLFMLDNELGTRVAESAAAEAG